MVIPIDRCHSQPYSDSLSVQPAVCMQGFGVRGSTKCWWVVGSKDIDTIHSKVQRTLCKKKQKEWNIWEMGRRTMKCHHLAGLCHCNHKLNSCCWCLHWVNTRTVLSQSGIDYGEAQSTLPLTVKCLLLIDSGRGRSIVHTGDATSLQWRVPIEWLHRWP